ncbi:MAG: ABC transporter ATP-binding protein [Gemmatimonadaceae bacterium]
MTAPAITSPQEEEALGKAYDSRLMRRPLAFAAPYMSLVVVALVFLVIEGGLQLVGPFLTQHVIDVAIPRHDLSAIRAAALLYAVALLVEFGASYGETWFTALLGQNVMRDLRLTLFGHLQRLPIAFFDRNPTGRLITRVTSDVETLNELFTAGVVSGLGDLFTLLAISVAMLVTDWRLAIAAFVVIPFVVLVSHIFRTSVRQSYRDIRTRLARINSFLQERLTGMRIVQIFGREADEARRFDELNESHLSAHLKSITVYALYFPAIEVLTSVALASLIVAGASRVRVATLTVGTVAAFLQLVRRFFQPLQDLSDKYNTLQTAMASSERIFHLLDTDPWVDVEGEPASAAPRRVHSVEVTFEDVWFAYEIRGAADRTEPLPARIDGTARQEPRPTEPEWVLRGVSFTVLAGETLAIVGHTGAGKTTIVNLLMRFHDPQGGRILVNGVDICTMSLEQLRSLIGYVQQDIFLFAGDVASNIRLSAPLSDRDVEEAATQVGADRIIRRLPNGYSQLLGERGASISVGERQLLSFARAVAADPALLILDEATSAVDSEIEAEIQRALTVLLAGRTTIAIAHRLSTIVDADTIIVMHHGEVVERGSHAELLSLGGLYARLWRLQI